jgi:SnoaL-like domain
MQTTVAFRTDLTNGRSVPPSTWNIRSFVLDDDAVCFERVVLDLGVADPAQARLEAVVFELGSSAMPSIASTTFLLGALALGVAAPARAGTRGKDKPVIEDLSGMLRVGGRFGRDDVLQFLWNAYGLPDRPTILEVGDMESIDTQPKRPVVGWSADGATSWISAELSPTEICSNGLDAYCRKNLAEDARTIGFHVTVVFDHGTPLAVHLGRAITAARQKEQPPPEPTPLATRIAPGAADAVALMQRTLADPAALAATASDRADVVLFGSDPRERFVGGKTVRATLTRWALSFTVRDGLVAGANVSGTVVWAAANVDARGKKDKTATPYRALFVYEKQPTGWKLVQLHFSLQ